MFEKQQKNIKHVTAPKEITQDYGHLNYLNEGVGWWWTLGKGDRSNQKRIALRHSGTPNRTATVAQTSEKMESREHCSHRIPPNGSSAFFTHFLLA